MALTGSLTSFLSRRCCEKDRVLRLDQAGARARAQVWGGDSPLHQHVGSTRGGPQGRDPRQKAARVSTAASTGHVVNI